ncbi:MAG TPA: ABC transporter permease subunit [Armatimonadota bacterium]|nr:ABC transporter permease subunit [Armatimonadota bacterium]
MVVVQALLVLVIAPALTAGTFSGQRERGSLDHLLLSRYTAAEIVFGKLNGAMAQLLTLQLATLPIVAILAATFGGIALWEVLVSVVALQIEALMFGCVGLLASCQAARTLDALVRAYVYLLLTLVGFVLTFPVGFALVPVITMAFLPSACISLVDRWRSESPLSSWDRHRIAKARQEERRANRHRQTDVEGWSIPDLSGREDA